VLAVVARANGDELEAKGWLSWRGPQQNGTSLETGLPERWVLDGENHLWTYAIAGRATPVISNGRVYLLGYDGEGETLREVFACLDEQTGKLLFAHRFLDFLSDTVYSRYAIASPTIDPATGNLYFMTSPGLFCCFSPDGKELWEHDLMGELGRLTFPNARTGSPVIDGELVIVHCVTSHWGPMGPAADRFYAFDKTSGSMVWESQPGILPPKDNPYSQPVLAWANGRRVLYSATGCGNIVCVDARTGDPLWRFPFANGGVCTSVVLHGNEVIAIQGVEAVDNSQIGRMVAIHCGAEPKPGEAGPAILDAKAEAWRNELGAFSSSPVLVGDRVYQTTDLGDLCAVDATTGKVLWVHKLAPDQVHASPVWGDGKLYVPMNNGTFFIIRPKDEGPEILSQLSLEGNCLGQPAIWNGKVYVQTTAKLYCFGKAKGSGVPAAPGEPAAPAAGEAARLQIVPTDFLAAQGETVILRVRALDAKGALVDPDVHDVEWNDAALGLKVAPDGTLAIPAGSKLGTGVLAAKKGTLAGSARVRIVGAIPFREDFESTALAQPDAELPAAEQAAGAKVGFPPASWIGAKMKWVVRDLDGNKVLAKTLENPLFQRSMGFTGDPRSHDYTVSVDIMTDGNRRTLSNGGVVNQRYLFELKGNHQEIEISSNMERFKHSVPFVWKAHMWYRMKTRVDTAEDGSATVRAKVWPRDEKEPDAWTIEVRDPNGHRQGAPGIFSIAPQSQFRVYLDNYEVVPNE
jgi:outer membrane protein assembly factor BamB